MVKYKKLSLSEAQDWQAKHPVVPGEELTNLYLNNASNYRSDEVVAILGLVEERIVGRLLLGYTDLLINGQLTRCVVGQWLLVEEAYRSEKVGLGLLITGMRLGMPYIAASVSASAFEIFDKWRQFLRIDASPVYPVGVDFPALVRTIRLAGQHYDATQTTDKPAGWKVALTMWQARNSLRSAAKKNNSLEPIAPADADALLDEIASAAPPTIRIPWDREKLRRGLRGEEENFHAWVVRRHGAPHLVSIYTREHTAGMLRSSDVRTVTLAEMTEVYPPVHDEEAAFDFASFGFAKAQEIGASLLFLYAMTPAWRHTCKRLGLVGLTEKTVFIVPAGVEKPVAELLGDPENWWCRARNEIQFEEAYQGEGVSLL